MTRTVEVEMTIRTNNVEKAINKFFIKHRVLDYWKDTFEYMKENNDDFFSDTIMADGTKNSEWRYALHLDISENLVYMCVIER